VAGAVRLHRPDHAARAVDARQLHATPGRHACGRHA